MTHFLGQQKKTLMKKKYFSLLLGGTMTMMVVSFLLMSDSIIAGALIGADAVAGITLVTPMYSLAAFFGCVFSLGVPILYSVNMGKFDKGSADRVFGFGLLMCIAAGLALFLLTSLFGDAWLQTSSPLEPVLSEARGYLFWMRFVFLLQPFESLISAMVYSDGDETLSTVASGVQGIGNIIASILLSRIMGIGGIGLASFLFELICLMILLAHFRKESNSLRWNLYFSAKLLKEVVWFSMVDSSTYLFLAILTAALNTFVSARFGAGYLLVVSAITLCRELQLVFDGIGEAITPIISVYLGEENKNGLRFIYALAEKSAIIEGMAVTIVLMLFAPFVPGILGVHDPELIRMVVRGVRLLSLGSVFVSLLYLITSYYLILEKIPLSLAVCALRDMVLSISLTVALGSFFGINGLFIGLAAAPALAYAILLIYLIWCYGREDTPLLLSTIPGSRQSWLFHLVTEPGQIIGLQKKVEELLIENKLDEQTIGRVKLLIEDLYMLIREKNGGKDILSECSVFWRPEGVQIISKDEGVLFDISEEDVQVTSIVAFIVSGYMEQMGKDRHYLTTMSINRSSFLIKTSV